MSLTPAERRPRVDGQAALDRAKTSRDAATVLSIDPGSRPAPVIRSNGEEVAFEANPVSSFSKGLPHDRYGRADPAAYELFVRALHDPQPAGTANGFPAPLGTQNGPHAYPAGYAPWAGNGVAQGDRVRGWHYDVLVDGVPTQPALRKWESPLAGHSTDLMGPATAGVAMPPAPKLGSAELVAEMAEIYAMALVRDVPFDALTNPATAVRIDHATTFTLGELLAQLRALPWFDPAASPKGSEGGPLNACEARRRAARFEGAAGLTLKSLFRGSTKGAMQGPFLSQFLLVGSKGRSEGNIAFGVQDIDQRCHVMPDYRDYMTTWLEWLDVQNGARHVGSDLHGGKRFLTTPRDMASYVHVDQLYQAYFNATLLMFDRGVPFGKGLPETVQPTRAGFATWGPPHLLSLMAEVASRGLKAVRRQKFLIHRRARPEVIAARLALGTGADAAKLGAAAPAIAAMLAAYQTHAPKLLAWIERLNARNNDATPAARGLVPTFELASPDIARNVLLPMAFPEGSPMHPAYGAGHATVAGASITILKAFFDMLDASGVPRKLVDHGFRGDLVGHYDYLRTSDGPAALTIQGELDKLAGNIAIARNMAGVHYYTDYYESLRMGERIAVGILQEQMLTSPEPVKMAFDDFDGHRVTIAGVPGVGNAVGTATLTIAGMSTAEWWERNIACYLPEQAMAAE